MQSTKLATLLLFGLCSARADEHLFYGANSIDRATLKLIGANNSPIAEADYIAVTDREYRCRSASGEMTTDPLDAKCPELALQLDRCTTLASPAVAQTGQSPAKPARPAVSGVLFNGVCRELGFSMPRDLIYSGHVLRIGKAVQENNLYEAIQNLGERGNLGHLSLEADTIEISSPLRLAETWVDIHARQLLLVGDGSVDVTPRPEWTPHPLQAHAWPCPWKSEDMATAEGKRDDPTPYLKAIVVDRVWQYAKCWDGGPPNWQSHGADGHGGAPGGTITLAIGTLSTPIQASGRFVVNGGPGQTGAPGLDGIKGRDDKAINWEQFKDECGEAYWCHWVYDDILSKHLFVGASGFIHVNQVDVGVKTWPGNGMNAMSGGASGQGGPPGRVRSTVPISDSLVIGAPGATPPPSRYVYMGGIVEFCGQGQDFCQAYFATVYQAGINRPYATLENHPVTGGIATANRASLPPVVLHPYTTHVQVSWGFLEPHEAALTPAAQASLQAKWQAQYQAAIDANASTTNPLFIVEDAPYTYQFALAADPKMGMKTIEPAPMPTSWITAASLEAMTSYLRDEYRAGQTKNVSEELEVINVELARLSASDVETLGDSVGELFQMRARLNAGLDYFGNPPGYAPNIKFAQLAKLYRTYVDSYAGILALGIALDRQERSAADRKTAVIQALTVSDQQFSMSINRMQKMTVEAAQLAHDAEDTSQAYLAVQDALQRLIEKLMKKAQENVAAKGSFEKGIRSMTALMKVIPVYQPALGLVATGLEQVVHEPPGTSISFDSAFALANAVDKFNDPNLRAQSEQATQAYLAGLEQSAGAVTDSFGAVVGGLTDGSEKAKLQDAWEARKAALKNDVDALKTSQTAKDTVANAQSLLHDSTTLNTNQALGPDDQGYAAWLAQVAAVRKRAIDLERMLRDQADANATARLPQSEVESELAKLEQDNAEYKETVAKIRELLLLRHRLAEEETSLLARWGSDVQLMTSSMGDRVALGQALVDDELLRDASTTRRMRALVDRSRDYLLRYQYELAKAYEYEFVEPAPSMIDGQHLTDRFLQQQVVDTTPQVNWSDLHAVAEVLKPVLLQDLEQMQDKLYAGASSTLLPTGLRVTLSSQQIDELKSSKRTTIRLGAPQSEGGVGNVVHIDQYSAVRLASLKLTAISSTGTGNEQLLFYFTPQRESVLSGRVASDLFYYRHCASFADPSSACGSGTPPTRWSATWSLGQQHPSNSAPDTSDLCASTDTTCVHSVWLAAPSFFSEIEMSVEVNGSDPSPLLAGLSKIELTVIPSGACRNAEGCDK